MSPYLICGYDKVVGHEFSSGKRQPLPAGTDAAAGRRVVVGAVRVCHDSGFSPDLLKQPFFEPLVVVGLVASAVLAEVPPSDLISGEAVEDLHHGRKDCRVGSLGLLVLLGKLGWIA